MSVVGCRLVVPVGLRGLCMRHRPGSAVDVAGRLLWVESFPATPAGYRHLGGWLRGLGVVGGCERLRAKVIDVRGREGRVTVGRNDSVDQFHPIW